MNIGVSVGQPMFSQQNFVKPGFSVKLKLLGVHDNSRPYYELKAHYNNLLELQKTKVQAFESQVSAAKLTYADALRNLEHISDEIHRTRNSANKVNNAQLVTAQISLDSNESSYVDDFSGEFKSLPTKFLNLQMAIKNNVEDVDGYRSLGTNVSPGSSISHSEQSEKILHPNVAESHSSEWTEINLDVSSPEEDVLYNKHQSADDKPILQRQKTLPNPHIDNEFNGAKGKIKLDTNISNWISRSSAKQESDMNYSRRQSLDNILGPTSEKVKEIWSHGMMMFNISSLTERRNSEPKAGGIPEGKVAKKLPSPLEKTLTYLNVEDDTSDTESLSSVDMLNEDQIHSLMLDKEISHVCEQVLGTPINEVVSFP